MAVFLLPVQADAGLGRERQNHVVLRAFGAAGPLDQVSSRISRRHLMIRRDGTQFSAVDPGSTYGTSLEGRRLPPREPVPLPQRGNVELANGAAHCTLHAFGEAGVVRLQRHSLPHHVYTLIWTTSGWKTLGSDLGRDPIWIPRVRPGHAQLWLDLTRGTYRVGPQAGPVRAGARELAPGESAELGIQPIFLGDWPLLARQASWEDFIRTASELQR